MPFAERNGTHLDTLGASLGNPAIGCLELYSTVAEQAVSLSNRLCRALGLSGSTELAEVSGRRLVETCSIKRNAPRPFDKLTASKLGASIEATDNGSTIN